MMDFENPTLIIDCNNIAYASYYSMDALANNGERVEVIFGFLNRVLSLAKEFKAKEFVFCWDSKQSFRKKFFPGYKDRKKEEKEDYDPDEWKKVYNQFNQLRTEILPKLGFQPFMQIGYESDDLMAKYCEDNPQQEKIIVSADNDLFQCLDFKTAQYLVNKKEIFDKKDYTQRFGISSYSWREVKALAGCSSDTIPGIQGVGEPTAIKYLCKNLKETSKVYQRIVSDEGKEIFERNFKLVSLPYKGTEPLPFFSGKRLMADDFWDLFVDLDFQYNMNDNRWFEWVDCFDLKD